MQVNRSIHDNLTYMKTPSKGFEKIIPAIWELYPIEGSRTLFFGKNLISC